jgi:DNA-binding NtrC family response regulator
LEHYLYRFGQQYEAARPRLSADARDLLRRYNWPGNVRELRNVAEQAVVLVRAEELTADALRPFLRGVSAAAGLTLAHREPPGGAEARERELVYRALLELRMEMREVKALLFRLAGVEGGPRPAPAGPHTPPTISDATFAGALADDLAGAYEPALSPAFGPDYEPEVVGGEAALFSEVEDAEFDAADAEFEVEDDAPEPLVTEVDDADGLARLLARGLPLPTMEQAERALIVEALRRFEGNRRRAAEALGMSERTLYRKIKDLEEAGIDV